MGVPAFFRWLSRKYPSVIVPCVEEKAKVCNGVKAPIDCTLPNPNSVEFDNLYLDMNGIIHPCTHPEDKPAPKNEDEMMVAIFECIDRLFSIVRPRKLIYMAIDGVAPRAKMNQQRSRRFRASKETSEKILEMARIRSELAAKGCFLPPEKTKGEHFDSNCITPGTPFMARLSSCLHYYIHDRMNKDPAWKGIKVILSDANVPGEGEHKIMDYIRRQRGQPDHDPNTQHCLCGADADLIMLGLATHEPNFTIIREEFKPNQPRPCDMCGQNGHEMKDCQGLPKELSGALDEVAPAFSSEGEFIFVRLCVLREYLEKELEMPNLPFPYDFERAIDDWVFMCFFVGNDFLPHLPSLEIREGAIDRLVTLYKNAVYKTGGFITDSGDVNLNRVQLILSELGKAEDEIFKKRQQDELSFRARNKAKQRRMKMMNNRGRPSFLPQGQFAPTPLGRGSSPVQNPRQEAYRMRTEGMHSQSGQQPGQKRKFDDVDKSDEEEEPNDEVRLWEDGFKNRYYESKFDVDPDNLKFRQTVAFQYVRGLCWVLRYYYQGCASWKWYFPYHYAPFASDFMNIGDLSTEFERDTKPFRPLEQLMGVFPAASSSHVPEPWAKLMSDPDSPIIDFYPLDFKIDLNGKKFAWQGVALLPFVEESRLFKAVEPYYSALTAAEVKRNVRGDDRLYIGHENQGFVFARTLYKEKIGDVEVDISVEGMRGKVLLTSDCVSQGGTVLSPVAGLHNLEENRVVCVNFRDPKYPDSYVFAAKRLPGAKNPDRVLKPEDLDAAQRQAWRPQVGFKPSNQRGSLGRAGHRMVGHYGGNRQAAGQGMYSNVPPTLAGLAPLLKLANSLTNSQQGNWAQNRGYGGGVGGGGGGGGYQRSDRGSSNYSSNNYSTTNYSSTNYNTTGYSSNATGYSSSSHVGYSSGNTGYSSSRNTSSYGGSGGASAGYGYSTTGNGSYNASTGNGGSSTRWAPYNASQRGSRDTRRGDQGNADSRQTGGSWRGSGGGTWRGSSSGGGRY